MIRRVHAAPVPPVKSLVVRGPGGNQINLEPEYRIDGEFTHPTRLTLPGHPNVHTFLWGDDAIDELIEALEECKTMHATHDAEEGP